MDPSKEPAASSELEALKKKVAELEATVTRAKHVSAGVAVSIAILLGVGILQAPTVIAKTVDEYVKNSAKTRIDEIIQAETEARVNDSLREEILKTATDAVPSTIQKELDRRGIKSTIIGNAQRGCAIAGAMQYCWGTFIADQPSANMHTRQFDQKFARAFASEPTVTASVLTKSDGTTYALYEFERTPEGFSGTVVSSRNAKGEVATASHKVTMAYFALAPTRGGNPAE